MPFCAPRRSILMALLLALSLIAVPLAAAGQGTHFSSALPLTHVDNGPNSAWAQNQHYLILVSLDGFRWDYAKRDNATHLLAIGKAGVWAPEGMLPAYPSLTYPNHYTLVTGLYPEHHGIVANSFLDPARDACYSMYDPNATSDGTWYGGVPLWSLAESRGMRTACFLWVGCDAKIAGFRPTYYATFDSKTQATPQAEQARIDDTLTLLHLPAADRPHFIAIYFSEPDHEGHEFGPDARETREAALRMDVLVGKLRDALRTTGLPIDLVVVSDHGMVKSEGTWIDLDDFADLSAFETVGDLLYGKTEEDRARVYNQLKHVSSQFMVYRRKDVPAGLNYNQNPREGDPVIVATGPFAIRAHKPQNGNLDHPPTLGMHGFDPRILPEMKASFFAAGPDLREAKTVAPFDNVNLYPWMAHLLGLTPPKNDGSLNILSGTLRDDGVAPEK
ncbi:MAG: ectonucleotide pyrophosphatase/phosphodiesterase [Terracidiphilus sp.]